MRDLILAMSGIGLDVDAPVLDGEIHRCPVAGKTSKKNGWYVGRVINDKIFSTFGRWDTGESIKWKSHGDSELTSTDFEILKFLQNKIAAEKKGKQAKAKKQAVLIWGKSKKCNRKHPYLKKKMIGCMDTAKQYGDLIVVPIYNCDGELVNLQHIFKDGSKKFLYGGEISGCATSFSNPYVAYHGVICVCEGFATGASIYEATGHKTVVTFNAHNLVKVSSIVRAKNPDSRIIICADDDHSRKGGNIGIEKGKEAAGVCGGILRYPKCRDGGTDFNDLRVEQGLKPVADIVNLPPNILTTEDVKSKEYDLTLHIPPSILNVPGLISKGLEACRGGDLPDIIQYNFPLIISIIARAISGKIRYKQIWPSMYNIKVGGTSTGKTDSDKVMKAAIRSAGIADFYGPTDFSSGPGLLRGLAEQPQCLINIDEISYLFKRYDKPDPISAGKISALLELYTAAGQMLKKPYGDSKKSIEVNEPCLVLLGNATPQIFDDLRPEDFETGLIQRFDFWFYGGPIPYRNNSNQDLGLLQDFVGGVSDIFNSTGHGTELQRLLGSAIDVGADLRCQKILNEYSKSIIDESNKSDSPGETGINSRRFHAAIKYALVYMASVRDVKDLAAPIDSDAIQYGIQVADMLAGWKIKTLSGRVHEGQFHRDCEIFKEAIRACLQQGISSPTMSRMMQRRAKLKSLKPREIEDIKQTLVVRNEILIEQSRGTDVFYLVNDEI